MNDRVVNLMFLAFMNSYIQNRANVLLPVLTVQECYDMVMQFMEDCKVIEE
jgi:hypothetical protein